MRRYVLLQLLPLLLVVLALAGLGAWLVPQLRAPVGRTYRFYVEDATGLPVGTEVKFRGLTVGQVMQVLLDEPRSRERGTPWFQVQFQSVPGGEKLLNLWSFRAVTLDKETPLIGATVVTLTDAAMPGGATPDVLELKPAKGDDLSSDLHEITAGIKQAVATANDAMLDLKKELEARPEGPFNADRPTRVAAMLGSLQDAAHQLSVAGDHISTLTDSKGAVTVALGNISTLTSDLTNDARPFQSTFIDLKKTSSETRSALEQTRHLLDLAAPSVQSATSNAAQMLDTLKREPWRIIWKSTKEYNDAAAASPSPSPAPKRDAARRKRPDAG